MGLAKLVSATLCKRLKKYTNSFIIFNSMNSQSKYRCVKCGATSFSHSSTFWKCNSCKTAFPTFQGMPMLYQESDVGKNDKSVRAHFYNGVLGKFYQYLMPFMHLPVRPFAITKKDWSAYFLTVALLVAILYSSLTLISGFGFIKPGLLVQLVSLISLFIIGYFFVRNPHFFYLFIIAIPVKISLKLNRYKPEIGFKEVHKRELGRMLETKGKKLNMLDISTGTGNSLYRHGWMSLEAEYTGLDLSEVMLAQCQRLLRDKNVSVDLVVGDAANLPFADDYFDIVTNYGAVNGYTDVKKALSEMYRVTKKDGLMLFLDEQMYEGASFIERVYFNRVIASHCTIRHAPVELLPAEVKNIDVSQVYEFYYICTCYKS
jgi:ubiquinone/menaquinone biosynthesis C-methylase UbiE